jgi:zinc transporter
LSDGLPVAAFDIDAAGAARPAPDLRPAPEPGSAWRWLHFGAADPAFVDWARGHLPAVVSSALTQTEVRPRCEPYGEGLMLTLRGVNRNPGQQADDMVSLRLWVTPRLVVSARLRRLYAADELREGMAAGRGPASPGAFLVALARGLTDRIEDLSLALESSADRFEDQVLEADHSMVDALGPLRASAIKLRRHVGPQREALARLVQLSGTVAEPAERSELAEIADRTTRSVEELESVAARIAALQDHIASQTTERLARNSFLLSVVAAIFLPLGFLTGLFGVNLAGMPGLDWPWAFAAFSAAALGIAVALALLFRFMRWF